MPHLKFIQLSLGYSTKEPIFSQLSGEITGTGLYHLTGKNGIGKSTLLEATAGYLRPLTGTITTQNAAGQKAQPALVRTQPELVPFMTLSDNLQLFCRRFGTSTTQLEQSIDELELHQHLEKLPTEVSTGTLRKAWLLCGLQLNNTIICFDEPFNGLDQHTAEVLGHRLYKLGQTKLIILVSHFLPNSLRPTSAVEPITQGTQELMHFEMLTHNQ